MDQKIVTGSVPSPSNFTVRASLHLLFLTICLQGSLLPWWDTKARGPCYAGDRNAANDFTVGLAAAPVFFCAVSG